MATVTITITDTSGIDVDGDETVGISMQSEPPFDFGDRDMATYAQLLGVAMMNMSVNFSDSAEQTDAEGEVLKVLK